MNSVTIAELRNQHIAKVIKESADWPDSFKVKIKKACIALCMSSPALRRAAAKNNIKPISVGGACKQSVWLWGDIKNIRTRKRSTK